MGLETGKGQLLGDKVYLDLPSDLKHVKTCWVKK